MAVATAPIDTPERPGNYFAVAIAAATVLYQGTLTSHDANGRLVAAADTAGYRVAGLATDTFDNSAGAAGAINGVVARGIFRFANSAANAITAAMIGKQAFVEDNTTVANTSTNRIVAGRIVDVDAAGVWVSINDGRVLAGLAATSTDGTAAAASANLTGLAAECEKIGDDVRAVIAALNS